VRIRALTAEDRDAVVDLWHEAGLTRPWNDPASDFDRALSGATSAVLGAFRFGRTHRHRDGRPRWPPRVGVLPGRDLDQTQGWTRSSHDVRGRERLREQGAVKVNVPVRIPGVGVAGRGGTQPATVMLDLIP
jgi:hypothetical protein